MMNKWITELKRHKGTEAQRQRESSVISYWKQNKLKLYFIFHISYFIFFSCSSKITPKTGEYLIQSQNFKGNQQVSTEELAAVIPNNQIPNLRPFGLPILPGVALYNVGKKYQQIPERQQKIIELQNILDTDSSLNRREKERYERKIAHQRGVVEEGHWLMKKGEAPTFSTEVEAKETAKKIQTYLQNKGFLEAAARSEIALKENNAKITYLIDENRAYKWRKIAYKIRDARIDSLVRKTELESPLKNDLLLNRANLDAERSRIERLLKENGYYTFSKQYVRIVINDTIKTEKENEKWVDILVLVDNPASNRSHQVFSYESVQFTALDAKKASLNKELDTDTTVFNGLKYIFLGRSFPVKLLNSRINIFPNRLYNVRDKEETEQQLSALEQFTFTNIRIDTLANSRLRATITAPTLDKFQVTNELGMNSIAGIGGGALNSNFKIRNVFGGLEALETNGRFAFEGQAGYNNSFQRSLEFGLNTSLVFPDLLLLKKSISHYKSPKTSIGAGFNYSAPSTYRRYNFRLSANYLWQTSSTRSFTFSPFDVTAIRTDALDNQDSRDFFAFLEEEFQRGNNLKLLFGRQFSSSISGSYTYNTQISGQNRRSEYLRLFAESGGTFMDLLRNPDKEYWLDRIAGEKLEYFQFLKFSADFRRTLPFNQNKAFAYRINTGIAIPYGDNVSLPYEKNFFIGGASSVRAWSPRILGPGSSKPDLTKETKQYLPQPGDILIEGSAEYRKKLFHFVGDINGAVFVDVGNVWKLRGVPTKPNQANFDFGRFMKEFAVGTGFGFRFDMSYFVLRWDVGIKVYDPSQDVGKRFVFDKIFSSKARIRSLYPDPYRLLNIWNIGVGYPF